MPGQSDPLLDPVILLMSLLMIMIGWVGLNGSVSLLEILISSASLFLGIALLLLLMKFGISQRSRV